MENLALKEFDQDVGGLLESRIRPCGLQAFEILDSHQNDSQLKDSTLDEKSRLSKGFQVEVLKIKYTTNTKKIYHQPDMQ